MTHPTRVLTLALATAASLALLPAAAMAGNGNGKGNGHSHASASHESHGSKDAERSSRSKSFARGGDDEGDGGDSRSHGSIASELKGMNSSHASQNAMEHASPNSRVGQNASYVAAAEATEAAFEVRHDARVYFVESAVRLHFANKAVATATAELTDAQAALQAAIDAGTDTTTAQAEVDAATAALDDALARQARLRTVTRATAVLAKEADDAYDAALAAEEDALLVASDGRELSEDAIEEYRYNLGL